MSTKIDGVVTVKSKENLDKSKNSWIGKMAPKILFFCPLLCFGAYYLLKKIKEKKEERRKGYKSFLV